MKTFSKVIAFIGMIAMLFSLVGCGKKGGDDTPKVPTKLIAKYSDGTEVTSLKLEVGESKTIEFSTDLKDYKLTKSYLKNAGEPTNVSCDKNNLSFTITGLKATGEQSENLVFTYKVNTKTTLTLTIPVTVYEYEPTELIASSTEETLRIGEEKVIALTTNPENRPLPEDAVVGWTSSNPEIASVEDGTVTGVAAGQATITATYKDLTATVNVTVKDSVAESIEAVIEPTSVKEGEKANITLKVKYDDADSPEELKPSAKVSFNADKDVVSIDENGVVTAKEVTEKTTVKITVTYTYKEGATPVSDVVELEIVPIVVDSLIAAIDQESLKEGETANISLKVKYDDGTESVITSDEVEIVADNAAVTIENGVVTANKVDVTTTVNITVTYTYKETDYTDEVSVTVLPYVATALIASAENEVLQLSGEDVVTTTITLTTEPDSKPLAASEAEFSVEENAAVTVSPDGVVTAVKPGTATVTVTYGDLTSEIVFTVNKDPNAPAEYAITVQGIEGAGGRFIISWTDDVYAISTGDASIVKDFTFGVEPKNGNDPAIAEGEKAVKIYMHTTGAAWANAGEKDFYLKITAKSGVRYIITGILVVNEDKTGFVKDIVVVEDELVPALKLSSCEPVLGMGAVELPCTKIDIVDFDPSKLEASSSNKDVATVEVVDGKIMVTAVSAGETTITATYGDVSAEATITVTAEVSEYAITVQGIEGAGGRFIISWTDDVYAISTGDASIVKDFTFGVEPKNGNDPAIAEGEKAVKIYMHTTGAAWANAGEKDFYLKITAKSGVTYIITGTLVVNEDKTGFVKNISVEQDVLRPAIKLSSNLVLVGEEDVELPLDVTDIPTFNAANLTVTSSAAAVATVEVVEGKILVTGLTAGTTTITATYTDVENDVDVSDELELEVKGELTNLISTLTIDGENIDPTATYTHKLKATTGEWDQQVTFFPDDECDGKVKAGDTICVKVTVKSTANISVFLKTEFNRGSYSGIDSGTAISLVAEEEKTLTVEGVVAGDKNDVKILLAIRDAGGVNEASDELTISNITLYNLSE